jgi:hypothetical protein
MDTKTIPLSELQADQEGVLHRCLDVRQVLVVELPDRRFIAIQPLLESDDNLTDELIENNPAFREMLAKSLASLRELFELPNP